MENTMNKYLAAGYSANYIIGELAKAAARVAKGQRTDGDCKAMQL